MFRVDFTDVSTLMVYENENEKMRMKMLLDMGIALLLCRAVSRHQCKFRGPAGRIIM